MKSLRQTIIESKESSIRHRDVTSAKVGDIVLLKKGSIRAKITDILSSTKFAVRTKSGDDRIVNLNAIESIISEASVISKPDKNSKSPYLRLNALHDDEKIVHTEVVKGKTYEIVYRAEDKYKYALYIDGFKDMQSLYIETLEDIIKKAKR